MSAPDPETRAAEAALVHRLRNRGDEDGQYATDPEVFAQEFIASMRGVGWRPVLALAPVPDWRKASGDAPVPDVEKPGSADYLAAKAAITARATGPLQALTPDNDPRYLAGDSTQRKQTDGL